MNHKKNLMKVTKAQIENEIRDEIKAFHPKILIYIYHEIFWLERSKWIYLKDWEKQ